MARVHQLMLGCVSTDLEVQSDGEEDQDCRHSRVSPQQQGLLASFLNDHELQHQSIDISRPQEGAIVALYRGAALNPKCVQM